MGPGLGPRWRDGRGRRAGIPPDPLRRDSRGPTGGSSPLRGGMAVDVRPGHGPGPRWRDCPPAAAGVRKGCPLGLWRPPDRVRTCTGADPTHARDLGAPHGAEAPHGGSPQVGRRLWSRGGCGPRGATAHGEGGKAPVHRLPAARTARQPRPAAQPPAPGTAAQQDCSEMNDPSRRPVGRGRRGPDVKCGMRGAHFPLAWTSAPIKAIWGRCHDCQRRRSAR